jgi:hypothetical protein
MGRNDHGQLARPRAPGSYSSIPMPLSLKCGEKPATTSAACSSHRRVENTSLCTLSTIDGSSSEGFACQCRTSPNSPPCSCPCLKTLAETAATTTGNSIPTAQISAGPPSDAPAASPAAGADDATPCWDAHAAGAAGAGAGFTVACCAVSAETFACG